MVDEADFEFTKSILIKINEVVSKMDSSVRVAAFEVLAGRYLQKPVAPKKNAPGTNHGSDEEHAYETPDTADLGAFISAFDTKKPVDALNVLVAWLYSQNGAQAFSIRELKELSDSCGLTIPARPDMTFKGAKNAGKALFAQSGKNWKLTISGELHVKEVYKVAKGANVGSSDD